MKIRRASMKDMKTLLDLYDELLELEIAKYDPTLIPKWSYTKHGIEYFTEMINGNYTSVAEVDDKVVGYLAGKINEKNDYELYQYGEIDNICVTKECRGQGIGTALIKDFMGYCKENGIEDFKVVACAKDRDAINFYHKLGFGDFDVTLPSVTLNYDSVDL